MDREEQREASERIWRIPKVVIISISIMGMLCFIVTTLMIMFVPSRIHTFHDKVVVPCRVEPRGSVYATYAATILAYKIESPIVCRDGSRFTFGTYRLHYGGGARSGEETNCIMYYKCQRRYKVKSVILEEKEKMSQRMQVFWWLVLGMCIVAHIFLFSFAMWLLRITAHDLEGTEGEHEVSRPMERIAP